MKTTWKIAVWSNHFAVLNKTLFLGMSVVYLQTKSNIFNSEHKLNGGKKAQKETKATKRNVRLHTNQSQH